MVFLEGEAKDSRQMHIDTIKTDYAPPSTHRPVNLDVQVESTLGEKTEAPVFPLGSRGIYKFHVEIYFHLESDLEAVKVCQCLSSKLCVTKDNSIELEQH